MQEQTNTKSSIQYIGQQIYQCTNIGNIFH